MTILTSTGNFENWAGDIAELGAVYPFPGSEGFMVFLGLAFWIGWHVLQLMGEAKEYAKDEAYLKSGKKIQEFIEDS